MTTKPYVPFIEDHHDSDAVCVVEGCERTGRIALRVAEPDGTKGQLYAVIFCRTHWASIVACARVWEEWSL